MPVKYYLLANHDLGESVSELAVSVVIGVAFSDACPVRVFGGVSFNLFRCEWSIRPLNFLAFGLVPSELPLFQHQGRLDRSVIRHLGHCNHLIKSIKFRLPQINLSSEAFHLLQEFSHQQLIFIFSKPGFDHFDVEVI